MTPFFWLELKKSRHEPVNHSCFFVYIFSFNGFYCCVNKNWVLDTKFLNFRVSLPRSWKISGWPNPDIFQIWPWFYVYRYSQEFFFSKQFPGIVTWKLRNFWVTIPGKYHHPEIALEKQLSSIAPQNHGQFWRKKLGGFSLGARDYWFMKNTQLPKSHATVPLRPLYIYK